MQAGRPGGGGGGMRGHRSRGHGLTLRLGRVQVHGVEEADDPVIGQAAARVGAVPPHGPQFPAGTKRRHTRQVSHRGRYTSGAVGIQT